MVMAVVALVVLQHDLANLIRTDTLNSYFDKSLRLYFSIYQSSFFVFKFNINMKRQYYLCLFVIVLSFFGCRTNNKNIETFIGTSTDICKEDVYLSDIINVKSIIPLETKTESLIGDCKKILKFADKYYISFNRNALVVFNEQGEFIRAIGKIGNGPGEYTSISDFSVTKDGIFINVNRQILQYTHDGEFLRSIPLDINLIGLDVVEDRILGYVTLDEHVSHILDMKGESLNSHHPSSKAVWIGTSSYYWPYGTDKYFTPLGSGNDVLVYDIKKDEYSYSKFVDLPDMLTLDEENKLIEKYGNSVMLKQYARIVWPVNANSTHMFFGTQRNDNDDVLWIKDVKSNADRAFLFEHIINDVSFTSVKSFFSAFTKSQNSFIAYIYPEDLKQAVSETIKTDSPFYEQMKTLADNLTTEDNIILIEYEIN